jgi:acyl carrier protein
LDKETLKSELKILIIETLRLEDVEPDSIKDEDPLFGEGLGLDSIDALELVVAIEKHYGVLIEDEEVGVEAFASVDALADFVIDKKSQFKRSPQE